MKTLALYSNKGGVGKTAAAVNLSHLAAQTGLKTLICDLDPQSSTTYYFRVKPKLKPGAKGFIRGGKPIEKSIKGTDYENLDLLPATLSHRHLAVTFDKLKNSKRRLSRIIDPLQDEYDLIILDCPPTINLLAENVLHVTTIILVPLIPTTLSVRSHLSLLSFCKKNNYDTSKMYAFLSMVDRRKKLHRELTDALKSKFNGVLSPIIPYSSEVEKMGLKRQPVTAFSPNSKAAKSYQALWGEIGRHLLAQ